MKSMIIGVPKEIKDKEFRVALTPAGVRQLVSRNHQVIVQTDAGSGSGISDAEYIKAGAEMVAGPDKIFLRSEMIVKVKEPLAVEYQYLRPGLILFTYLHLAPLPELTQALIDRKVTAIAYETLQDEDGSLPLLAPMSEVAGKLAVQAGAHFLEKEAGGRGILLGGATGVKPGRVVILGSGTVGRAAAAVAVGMGAEVLVIGRNPNELRSLEKLYQDRISTKIISEISLEQELVAADLVIGAVLIPGAEAPKLVTRRMLGSMKKGAVIVDVSIDQGGCTETSHPTTHSDPVYEIDGIVHYCVANMPGAVPRTSTFALTNATLPYILNFADQGILSALRDPTLITGINVYQGRVTNRAVAVAQGRDWQPGLAP